MGLSGKPHLIGLCKGSPPGMWGIFVKVSVSGPYWLREQEARAGERRSLEMHGRKLSTSVFSISCGDKENLYGPMPQQRGL